MNFYRKYRPQTVAELDLTSVREAMGRILKAGVISHAYLLTGPKGTGKTSSARILAKIIQCEKGPSTGSGLGPSTGSGLGPSTGSGLGPSTGSGLGPSTAMPAGRQGSKQVSEFQEPCNECVSCKAVMDGSHLGVVEMDAASNRGIDDIRQLRERVGLAPAQGNYTIYVIDEVHMLTTEAFNALLKTLEEPPQHAIFILCTTEAHKVPETIVSRCTEIHFQKATVDEVKLCLLKAVTGENLTVDEGVIDLISVSADGSFRDAMKTLEQGVDENGVIKLAVVESILGGGKYFDPQPLIQALLKLDSVLSLKLVEEKNVLGIDMVLFGRRLVEQLRKRLIEAVELGKGDTQLLIALTDLMQKRVGEMKYSPVPILPLEIGVIEWCEGSKQVPVPVDKAVEEKKSEVIMKAKEIHSKVSASVTTKAPDKLVGLEEVVTKWPELLKLVRPLNHSLEALLRASKPLEVDEKNWLTVEVFYTFHKEQLEQERYRALLEKQCESLFQTPVRLTFVLGKTTEKAIKKQPEIANITANVDEDLATAAEEIFS